jgi:FkbM family methyltransferase
MIFDLKQLIKKYNMNLQNIIHIGGHYGSEVKLYKEINSACIVEIFEPHPDTFTIMKNNVSNFSKINCHNVALGPIETTMKLFVETANQGQSNSLLTPKHHTTQYPHIRFNDTIEVPVKTLDSFNLDSSYNFISIDVQGFELEVLKGATETLKNIDYLIVEVNNSELYEGCCMVKDLDLFLQKFGLQRVETNWEGGTWGDGFYIKQ